jgi:hypothetical protein
MGSCTLSTSHCEPIAPRAIATRPMGTCCSRQSRRQTHVPTTDALEHAPAARPQPANRRALDYWAILAGRRDRLIDKARDQRTARESSDYSTVRVPSLGPRGDRATRRQDRFSPKRIGNRPARFLKNYNRVSASFTHGGHQNSQRIGRSRLLRLSIIPSTSSWTWTGK